MTAINFGSGEVIFMEKFLALSCAKKRKTVFKVSSIFQRVRKVPSETRSPVKDGAIRFADKKAIEIRKLPFKLIHSRKSTRIEAKS